MSSSVDKPDLTTTPRRLAHAEARRRRRRRLHRSVLALLILFVLAFLAVAPLFRPASSVHRPVTVRVPTGTGAAQIGELLKEKGVIRSAFAFNLYSRWRGARDKLKAGRYELSGDMTLAEIVAELQLGGLEDRFRVTIPEGYTLKQIAVTLEEKGIVDADDFLAAATDPAKIVQLDADFPLPKNTLEGYLFPDTYAFGPHTAPNQVLETMLMNFSRRFVRPYQREIAARGRDLHAIVTEASLIEREARVAQDRARIAGVLENRLQRGMRLDVDATVLYALGHHKDRVLTKDLEVASPYNTYRHKGLPPGPIANPGLPSLQAALAPEPNDYLYYVARPDGSHLFTRSLAEHEAATRQARQEAREQHNEEARPGE